MGDSEGALRLNDAWGSGLVNAEHRAAAIRDHIVPLIQLNGQRHQYGRAGASGPLHLTTWEHGAFRFVLRVPFAPPGVPRKNNAERLGPVPHRRSDPVLLPYGLDVWRRHRVLSVAWKPDGPIEVVAFRRGTWEDETLALG